MTFGDKLKQLRQAKDWTQPEAADAIGIEQSYLSKLENDKSIPSDEVFEQLLKGYDLSVRDLIDSLSDTECANLSDIHVVSQYITTAKNQARSKSDRWTKAAIISIVLGVGLTMSGETSIFFSDIIYEYRAADESDTIEFHEKYEHLEYLSRQDSDSADSNASQSSKNARDALSKMVFPPKPAIYFQSSSKYLGENFIALEPNKDGSQREFKLRAKTQIDAWHNKVLMTLGLMLLTAGALMIGLMRKWKS